MGIVKRASCMCLPVGGAAAAEVHGGFVQASAQAQKIAEYMAFSLALRARVRVYFRDFPTALPRAFLGLDPGRRFTARTPVVVTPGASRCRRGSRARSVTTHRRVDA